MDNTPVFEAHDLRISARADDGAEIPIVKGVDITVNRGEVVALIGESGSGKTTIALSALGYTKPGLFFAGGTVRLLGQDMIGRRTKDLREIRRAHVAYLAQSAAAYFNPSLRIMEQVIEAVIFDGRVSTAEARARAVSLFDALELSSPQTIGDRYPHQVSGGQLQRLMAAMALCGKPDLIVLDEPTTALDVTTQIEVLKTFKKVIRDEGTSAIYVSHDLAVVAQIADTIAVLYNGELQERGAAEMIVSDARHPYTRRLMAAVRPLPRPGQNDTGDRYNQKGPPVLCIDQVTAGYGRSGLSGQPAVPVLQNVSFDIEKGNAVGIIGESGCGKSTLAKVIAGDLPAASGTIQLSGTALHPFYRKRSKGDLRKIQLVHQNADVALNPRQRIVSILGRPLEFYHGYSSKECRKRVFDILEKVDLTANFAFRYPHELSGGQKQRVNLARALAAEPELIICDEVTSALDSIVGANIIELLKRLRRDTGVSLAFISHDLSTIASFADQVVVLYAGRVVERGPTNMVLSPPYHPYTRLLISSVPEMRTGWLEDRHDLAVKKSKEVDPDFSNIGCPFFARCPLAIKGTCDTTSPPSQSSPDREGHVIVCHEDLAASMHGDDFFDSLNTGKAICGRGLPSGR